MRITIWAAASLALAGCGFEAQCGSTQGFVHGAIEGVTEAPVEIFAQGDALYTGEVSADGASYELNLEGDALYTVWAEDAAGCRSPEQVVEVFSCEELGLDFAIDPLDCGG